MSAADDDDFPDYEEDDDEDRTCLLNTPSRTSRDRHPPPCGMDTTPNVRTLLIRGKLVVVPSQTAKTAPQPKPYSPQLARTPPEGARDRSVLQAQEA